MRVTGASECNMGQKCMLAHIVLDALIRCATRLTPRRSALVRHALRGPRVPLDPLKPAMEAVRGWHKPVRPAPRQPAEIKRTTADDDRTFRFPGSRDLAAHDQQRREEPAKAREGGEKRKSRRSSDRAPLPTVPRIASVSFLPDGKSLRPTGEQPARRGSNEALGSTGLHRQAPASNLWPHRVSDASDTSPYQAFQMELRGHARDTAALQRLDKARLEASSLNTSFVGRAVRTWDQSTSQLRRTSSDISLGHLEIQIQQYEQAQAKKEPTPERQARETAFRFRMPLMPNYDVLHDALRPRRNKKDWRPEALLGEADGRGAGPGSAPPTLPPLPPRLQPHVEAGRAPAAGHTKVPPIQTTRTMAKAGLFKLPGPGT